MVLSSAVELEIGKRCVVDAITDARGVPHFNQPVVVMREATLAEWVESILEYGGQQTAAELLAWNVREPAVAFYQVSVD